MLMKKEMLERACKNVNMILLMIMIFMEVQTMKKPQSKTKTQIKKENMVKDVRAHC